ncbi:diacylglycerol/lipid kinase family protein [Halomarina halobia]|uniref:Diacylglycerol/lipid kinase family protein n=1 Tax=Halomarina halobia TaxID=3033386 RepID=A0ABD6A714_9EURY|nr:diacylglycerol kinase family protein [Halomarina sp. PSR21]
MGRASGVGGRRFDEGDRVLVLNPESGGGRDTDDVRALAAGRGFAVREAEGAAVVDAARAAAEDGASLVVACGGDGTASGVVNGIAAADAFDEVAFAVVPGGTGNNFAGNVGIEGVEHAFEVIEAGEERRIDLGRATFTDADGTADERLFLNSCVAGLTADASERTSADLKRRYGPFAYVATTLGAVPTYESLPLKVEGPGDGDPWRGDALCVFIGNARGFPRGGSVRLTQANVEDGLLEVALVSDASALELAGEELLRRLFRGETANIELRSLPSVTVTTEGEPIRFSLDGEMVGAERLDVGALPRTLRVRVGERYVPDPSG